MRHLRILPLCAFLIALSVAAPGVANDAAIAKQLSDRLRVAKTDGELKGFRIGVKVEDGVVWLSGHVQNDRQLQAALQLAREIPGVKLVVNDVVASEEVLPIRSAENTKVPMVQGQAGEIVSAASTAAASPQVRRLDMDQPASRTGDSHVVASSTPVPARLPAEPAVEQNVVAAAETTTYSGTQQPMVMIPNMGGYLGVVPTTAGAVPTPSFVQVVPAIMPVPTPVKAMPMSQVTRPMASPMHDQAAMGRMPQQRPMPLATARPTRLVNYHFETPPDCYERGPIGVPVPEYGSGGLGGGAYGMSMYENPQMPAYAWPSYASYPNYAAVSYPRQYSASAWPYIGPFYPYPQVPLGWRKVCLEWDDGWWMLDFKAK